MENKKAQQKTPVEKMIEWIETGCSTSGENWESFKNMVLSYERITLLEAKAEEIEYLTNFIDNKKN